MKSYLLENPDISFVCWQGEICAPGIQKNPHALKDTHLYLFHMTDSKNGRYDIREAKKIWEHYLMEVVPIVNDNYILPSYYEFDSMGGSVECKVGTQEVKNTNELKIGGIGSTTK